LRLRSSAKCPTQAREPKSPIAKAPITNPTCWPFPPISRMYSGNVGSNEAKLVQKQNPAQKRGFRSGGCLEERFEEDCVKVFCLSSRLKVWGANPLTQHLSILTFAIPGCFQSQPLQKYKQQKITNFECLPFWNPDNPA
jgi:hypothetical protein